MNTGTSSIIPLRFASQSVVSSLQQFSHSFGRVVVRSPALIHDHLFTNSLNTMILAPGPGYADVDY